MELGEREYDEGREVGAYLPLMLLAWYVRTAGMFPFALIVARKTPTKTPIR